MNRRLPPHRYHQALRAGLQHGIRRGPPARPAAPAPPPGDHPDAVPAAEAPPAVPAITYAATGLPAGVRVSLAPWEITGTLRPVTDASGETRFEIVPADAAQPVVFSAKLPPGLSFG